MPYKDPEKARENSRKLQQKYRLLYPEKFRARDRKWRNNNPDKIRRYKQAQRAKRGSGYEMQRILLRYEAEAGRPRPDRCDICGGNKGGIVFDHCHQRGIFRGWICNECNAALGHVEDSIPRLLMLIVYLERTAKLIPPQLTLPGI